MTQVCLIPRNWLFPHSQQSHLGILEHCVFSPTNLCSVLAGLTEVTLRKSPDLSFPICRMELLQMALPCAASM